MVESLKAPERVDLFKYLINEDKPNGEDRNDYSSCWYAGSQLEALRYYLDPKVKILEEFMEHDYQGECFAIMTVDGVIIIWRDSFGSCSGCDGLEDENGYKYIKSTITEGNTLQFRTILDAKQFVKEDQEGDGWADWGAMPLKMFDDVLRNIGLDPEGLEAYMKMKESSK